MGEAEARDSAQPSKKMKLEVAREEHGLCDLPELPLLEIAKHLDAQDLLHFSHASSKVWRAVGTNSTIWSKLLKNLNFLASSRLDHLAASFSTLFPSGCDEKRKFLVYKKTLSNWKTGDISQVWRHWARKFAFRNDTLLFGRVDDSVRNDELEYTPWNFTAFGTGIAANWTSQPPWPDNIFVFEKTVCIESRYDSEMSQ